MNENINIVEILKDAPKGTPLYSTILGECTLDHISGNFIWVLSPKCDVAQAFTKEGYIVLKYTWVSEVCCLFPSKHHATWNDFKSPWKHRHFEPFEKVLISHFTTDDFPGKEIWIPALYGYYDEEIKAHILTNGSSRDDKGIIPYESNEDKVGKPVE